MVAAKINHADSFREGDKVKVTRDIPHHAFPLSAGDIGIVYDSGRGLGVCFERHATPHAEPMVYFRYVDGKDRHILNFCVPAAPKITPVDVLLKMHDIEIKPEWIESWQRIEAAVAEFVQKKFEHEAAKEAYENHNSSTCPAFPSKIEDWREYLVWEKLEREWLEKRDDLEVARSAAEVIRKQADLKLAKLLPVCDVWFKFGNLGVRKISEHYGVQTCSWSEVDSVINPYSEEAAF
jgi:hypothetical protein